MDFMKIARTRYATKKFDGKRVPEEKIENLLEMIRLSASSFGLQPMKVKIITDRATKEKLVPASLNQPQIATCSHLLVFCAYTDIEKRIQGLESLMKKAKVPDEKIQASVQMMNDSFGRRSEEQKLAWAKNQVFIALGNAINGAKALGFDSCPMEGFDPKEYSRILGLPKNVVPVALCPVGYAADKPNPKIRFRKEDVFF